MKRSTIGLFSAAILIVVAAVDFGIAHAVGTNTHSEEVHGPIGGVR